MEEYLLSLLTAHPVLAPALYVFLRTVPIIIPPIPGVLVDMVGVAMFGWKMGFLLGLVASQVGATIAFYISRYFREPAAKYFVPLQRLHELEGRYSERQKFWALVAARILTAPFFDYASYAAGLTKMSYGTFILSTFISVLPFFFVIYYFGELAFNQGPLYLIMFFVTIVVVVGTLGRVAMKKFW